VNAAGWSALADGPPIETGVSEGARGYLIKDRGSATTRSPTRSRGCWATTGRAALTLRSISVRPSRNGGLHKGLYACTEAQRKGFSMSRRIAIAGSVVLCFVAGCGGSQEMPVGGPPPGGDSGSCPDWGCGVNDATVDGNLFFHELNLCGAQNSAGLTLIDVLGPGTVNGTRAHYKLMVNGDSLVAEPVNQKGAMLAGKRLIGTTIVLQPSAAAFEHKPAPINIEITAVGSTAYWVPPSSPVPTYVFSWRAPHATKQLCGRPSPRPGPVPGPPEPPLLPPDWIERVGTDLTLALAFAGDRYDGRLKTVRIDEAAPPCWVNIACAGSAAAKMHLIRHTSAGSDTAHTTTQPQRQAMLKMITDDICGTGESFTINGEKVFYEDMHPWYPFPTAPRSIESMWSERGALCLSEARREREDPTVRSRITRACAAAGHGLLDCPITPAQYAAWPELAASGGFGYGLSANP